MRGPPAPLVTAEQYGRIVTLHAEGQMMGEIAARVGVSYWQVRRALRLYRERLAGMVAAGGRPLWTYPDQELLRVAAETHREITEAEGFERPLI